MFKYGLGLRQDYAEALRWLQLSAAQAYPSAEFNLGAMYSNGTGVERDFAIAEKWYLLAAQGGHVAAQLSLADMLSSGAMAPQNKEQRQEQAARWYLAAAQQGDAEAQYKLGELYELGYGVPQSHELAFMWTHISAALANATLRSRVVRNRDMIGRQLSLEQLQHAQDLAQRCLDTGYVSCN
jgi:TPR repeat protein